MKSLRHGMAVLTLLALPVVVQGQSERRTADGDTEEFRQSYQMRTTGEARVRLDIDAGEIRLRRGTTDDEIRVWILYTKNQFTHTVSHNQRNNELEVVFDKKGWFDHKRDHTTARLDIELPKAVEMRIYSRIKAGEVDMELGGMHIVEFTMKTWAGEVDVNFDEPNKSEMRLLEINTKVGETSLRNLGNARFVNAEINGGIGEMTIDFRGAMVKDASAEVDLDIGETVIILPDKSGTKLSVSKFPVLSQVQMPFRMEKEGRYYYTKNYREFDQTFDLRLSSGIGELRIE